MVEDIDCRHEDVEMDFGPTPWNQKKAADWKTLDGNAE
jgi:hypothetical protein